jgi:hypothetical protein
VSSSGLGETPPQFLGTSFGYHFTNPRVVERRGSSTLPRGRKRDGDLASAIWSRWRHSAEDEERMFAARGVARTQSDQVPSSAIRPLQRDQGRTQSEALPVTGMMGQNGSGGWGRHDDGAEGGVGQDERGSWGRSRGYSVV